jgi:hypothetical protein
VAKALPDSRVADRRTGRKVGEGNYVDTGDRAIHDDTSGVLTNERDVKRQMIEQDLRIGGGEPGSGRPYHIFPDRKSRKVTKSLSKGRR